MHWFTDPITKHYADFEGRVGREEFWMFMLWSFLIQMAFNLIGLEVISLLISLAILLPAVAIGTRRLHDIDKSGWWQLIGLIPIIGWIIVIILLAQKTSMTENQYGTPATAKIVGGVVPKPPSVAEVPTPDVSTETSPENK
jgi:uncharacterized membrane protein YhaH (DUF805 family)